MLPPETIEIVRGVPHREALIVDLADPAGWSVVAKIKPLVQGQNIAPGADVVPALTLTASWQAASGNDPARFVLSATGTETRTLPLGRYIGDAAFLVGGVVADYADPVIYNVIDGVSL